MQSGCVPVRGDIILPNGVANRDAGPSWLHAGKCQGKLIVDNMVVEVLGFIFIPSDGKVHALVAMPPYIWCGLLISLHGNQNRLTEKMEVYAAQLGGMSIEWFAVVCRVGLGAIVFEG
jgi:hypothetical protein